jgi:hypothetical protein
MTNKEYVEECKKNGDYSKLGAWFWDKSIFLDIGPERTEIVNLYNMLTKREKKLCEGE